MPDMDGTDATKIIRGMGYTRPIVALTANAMEGLREAFLQNGFNDLISKPIQSHVLLDVLLRFIEQ